MPIPKTKTGTPTAERAFAASPRLDFIA
jgi:hypothetical protein